MKRGKNVIGTDETPTTYQVLGHTSDADWLARRQQGIGASEIGAILGLNRWATALDVYAEKLDYGKSEPGESAEWGRLLEPVILEEFGRRSGLTVFPDGYLLRSVEHPWCLATLDGYAEVDGQRVPVEVKTATVYLEDEWAEGAPECYRAQVNQQLLVTGAPFGFIACLLGGQRLMWARIERDEQLIRQIIRQGSEFWQRVQDRDPPPVQDGRDRAALGRIHSEDGTETELPADVGELIASLDELRAEMRSMKKTDASLCARIQEALGPHSVGFCANGWGATWKTQERAEHVVKASKSRVLRIKKPRKSKAA